MKRKPTPQEEAEIFGTESERVYIVSTSHRAREKLFRTIGKRPGLYATIGYKPTGEDIYTCTEAELPDVLKIKGIRKYSPKEKELNERIKF